MANEFLDTFRAQNEGFDDVPDAQLVRALHETFNEDERTPVSFDEFAASIGFEPPPPEPPDLGNDPVPGAERRRGRHQQPPSAAPGGASSGIDTSAAVASPAPGGGTLPGVERRRARHTKPEEETVLPDKMRAAATGALGVAEITARGLEEQRKSEMRSPLGVATALLRAGAAVFGNPTNPGEAMAKSLVEQAAGGAAAPVRQVLGAINEDLALTPEESQELGNQVVSGAASSVMFLVTRALPGGAALLPIAAMNAGQGEAIERAAAAGVDVEGGDAEAARLLGAVPGLLDVVPVERLFRLVPGLGGGLMGIAREAAKQGLVEGSQEALQEWMQNAILKITALPEQDLTEGVARNGLVGFLVGALMGGGFVAGHELAKRGPSRPDDPPAGTFGTPEEPGSKTAEHLADQREALRSEAPEARDLPPAVEGVRDAPPVTPVAHPGERGVEDAAEVARARRERAIKLARIRKLNAERRQERELVEALGPEAAAQQAPPPDPTKDHRFPGLPRVEVGSHEDLRREAEHSGAVLSRLQLTLRADAQGLDPLLEEEREAIRRQIAEVQENRESALQALAILERDATERAAPPTAPRRGVDLIEELDPSLIETDARTFQFKDKTDVQGVSQQLAGVQKWDAAAANVSLVYEQADGRQFIVDGHQRLALLKRLVNEGKAPAATKLNAIVLRETDGITKADARLKGAVKNLQEGGESTTALDIARVFRNGGLDSQVRAVVPPNRQSFRDGEALSRLSENAFGLVINREVSASHAAEVGRLLERPEHQDAAMAVLMKRPPVNRNQARLMVEQIRAAGFNDVVQDDIFGPGGEISESLVFERARVLDGAIKRLRSLKRAFKTAILSEAELERAGNQLKRESNQQEVTESERTIFALERLANTDPRISAQLNEAAKALAGGAKPGKVISDFLGFLRRAGPDPGARAGDRALTASHAPRGSEGSGPEQAASRVAPGEIAEIDFPVTPFMEDIGARKTLPSCHKLTKETVNMPRRGKIRKRIARGVLAGAVPVEGRAPRLYLMGGGGAAGKGTVKKLLRRGGEIPLEGVVDLDPDEIKVQIPEYAQIVKAGDMRAAAVVHEESSVIARDVLDQAYAMKADVIYDRTMGVEEKGIADIAKAVAAGYEVHLYGVTTPIEVAVERSLRRFRKSGRFVPPKPLGNAHRGFSAAFEKYLDLVTSMSLFDTLVPKDAPPILIAAKRQGESLAILDEKRYNMFKEKVHAPDPEIDPIARAIKRAVAQEGAGDLARPGGAGRLEEADPGRRGPGGAQPQPAPGALDPERLTPAFALASPAAPPAAGPRSPSPAPSTRDLFGVVPVAQQQLHEVARAVDERLSGGRGEVPAGDLPLFSDFIANYDLEDVAGVKRQSAIEGPDRKGEPPKPSGNTARTLQHSEQPEAGGGELYANPLGPVVRAYRAAADRALGWVDRQTQFFQPLKDLPGQRTYLLDRYRTIGRFDGANDLAREISDAFAAAAKKDPDAQIQVLDYLTHRGADPAAIQDAQARAAAVRAKRLIKRIGQRMVAIGWLPRHAFEANFDEYLPRMYLKHVLQTNDPSGVISAGLKLSERGYLRARQNIPEDVRKVILGQIMDPGFLTSHAIITPLRDLALLDFLTSIANTPGWVAQNSFVEVVRDGPTAQQIQLGLFGMQPGQRPGRIRYRRAAPGERGVRVTPWWLKAEAERLAGQARHMTDADARDARLLADDYREIAEDAFADLAAAGTPAAEGFKQAPDTPRYGVLRGMWVHRAIYDDVIGTRTFGQEADAMSTAEAILGDRGLVTKYTGIWKGMKVALNYPTQVRNFVSNGVLANVVGGISPQMVLPRLVQAARQINGNGVAWQIAKRYGVRGSTFSSAELRRLERDLKASLDRSFHQQLLDAGAAFYNFHTDLYGAMEGLFKTAVIIDQLAKGASEEDAALAAHEALFDYTLVPASVRYLRNGPVPFITFYYKAMGRMTHAAMRHPERFLPYVLLPVVLEQFIAAMYDVDDDDLETLKRALPDWLQRRGGTAFLPFKDHHGRWQAVSYGYFLPWQMLVELYSEALGGHPAEAFQTAGFFGGPYYSLIAAALTGVDPFTKRPIAQKGDPPAKQLRSVMSYLWTLNAPTYLSFDRESGIGATAHLWRSLSGWKMDGRLTWGQPGPTVAQSMARVFGVNIYPIDPQLSRTQNMVRMRAEVQATRSQMARVLRSPNLSETDRVREIDRYTGEITARQTQLFEYEQQSRVNPRLFGPPAYTASEVLRRAGRRLFGSPQGAETL